MLWLDKQKLFKSINRIKVFLFKQQWKETFIFLLFLLLSLGFWLLQHLQQEYEIEVSVPVKYRNIPPEMEITDEYPQEIIAKMRDRGMILINYSWLHSFSPIEVNLNDIQKERNYQVTRRTIETNISKHLISTTSLLSFEPETIIVEYNALQNKEVPVQTDILVELEPGYQISGEINVVPEKVHVYTNSNSLDFISSVKTVHTEIKKAKQTKVIKVRLQKIDNVRIEPDEVTVTIPIEEFTEKRITVMIGCKDLPDQYILRSFPSTVEVVCNVPISRFKELEETDFEIQIPFEEFETNRISGKIMIYLTKQPSWIVNPAIVPSAIEFIIEQNNQ